MKTINKEVKIPWAPFGRDPGKVNGWNGNGNPPPTCHVSSTFPHLCLQGRIPCMCWLESFWEAGLDNIIIGKRENRFNNHVMWVINHLGLQNTGRDPRQGKRLWIILGSQWTVDNVCLQKWCCSRVSNIETSGKVDTLKPWMGTAAGTGTECQQCCHHTDPIAPHLSWLGKLICFPKVNSVHLFVMPFFRNPGITTAQDRNSRFALD